MLAIIKTGGKQYIVEPGQKIKIEKLEGKEGKEIAFKNVLLVEKGNSIEIGTPLVSGAKVSGKILKQGRNKKVVVFRYKSKIRYQKKKGHRQPFSLVEIEKIEM
mgnify:CR=1 FL=1